MIQLHFAPFIDTSQQSFWDNTKVTIKFQQNPYAEQNSQIYWKIAKLEEDLTKAIISGPIEYTKDADENCQAVVDASAIITENVSQDYKVQIAYAATDTSSLYWSSAVRIKKIDGKPELEYNEEEKAWTVKNEGVRRYRYNPKENWKNGLIPIDSKIFLDNIVPRILNNKVTIEAETVSGIAITGETAVFIQEADIDSITIDSHSFDDKNILKGAVGYYFHSLDKNSWDYIGTSDSEAALVLDSYIENAAEYYYAFQNTDSALTIINQDAPTVRDYEYGYLCDKEHTFCLKYDGAVTSFKRNYQQVKQDTLGSAYPFIFQSSYSRYAEMPINAVISSDLGALLNEEFLEERKNQCRTNTAETVFKSALTPAQKFRAEKRYRDEVYAWLCNGKPKVFKSATEGLFLVQIMTENLEPKKEIGNMLYSVSATLYEIGEMNTANLMEYGLL